jgi:PAS domain S-box-containing protein
MSDGQMADRIRPRGVDREALFAAAGFAVVGITWIVASDVLVELLAPEWLETPIQTVKGILFMILASGVVFFQVRRYGRRWERVDALARGSADALSRSESRFRSLVEHAPGVVWLNEIDPTDPTRSHCVYVAPQLEDLLGRTPQDWMADDDLWLRVIHPEDRARVSEINGRADDAGVLSMEYRAIHRDGSTVWIHDEAVFVPADGDRPAYWQGVMVDITAQRMQDVALHELTESLRGVFEASPLAISVLEPDGRVRHWNPAAEVMFGWTAAEVVGKPLPTLPPDQLERFRETKARTLAGESLAGLETTRLRKDGSRIDVSVSTAPLVGEDGAITAWLGVIDDITDRRRADEERRIALDRQLRLATRLELLHQIDLDVLSSASIDEMAKRTLDHLCLLIPFDRGSVAVIDPETGRLSYAAVRSAPGMVMEPDLATTIPDALARELLARDVLVIDDLEAASLDTPFATASLRIGIRSVVLTSLRSEAGQMGSLILSSRRTGAFDEEAADIAKEVGRELAIAIGQARMRETLADRACELERLAEERRQMLHRIVRTQEEERERVALELHDGLGQLLTSISLFASDLEHEVAAEAKPRVRRVNDLVRRAIGDSRQLVWSLRPPELERLGLVPALRRLAGETSMPELTVDLHEELGDVRLAPESEAVVYRVVQEAVHNALKHAGASAISILLRRTNGQLTTLVEDNGRGFDPAAVPPDRGLGLIGMRERAELVEGALVVESASEAGTRVRLMVPIAAAEGSGR